MILKRYFTYVLFFCINFITTASYQPYTDSIRIKDFIYNTQTLVNSLFQDIHNVTYLKKYYDLQQERIDHLNISTYFNETNNIIMQFHYNLQQQLKIIILPYDNNKIDIICNEDRSYTINIYNKKLEFIASIITTKNHIIKSIKEKYPDNTYNLFFITNHSNPLRYFYTKNPIDNDFVIKKITYTNSFGKDINIDHQMITAWHEAGHALKAAHVQELCTITSLTIDKNESSQGHMSYTKQKNINQQESCDELKNFLQICLAGSIGEQFRLDIAPFDHQNKLLEYLELYQFKSDLQKAKKVAQKILETTLFAPRDLTIESIIFQEYHNAYQFIAHHFGQLTHLANQLYGYKTIDGPDVYKFLHIPHPSY
ncbi:MAG: hypothetical protein ACXWL2_00325 [Candidatus Chromulinivorax sp.]